MASIKHTPAVNVITLPDLVLLVQFKNGKIKKYDVKPLMKEIGAFKQFKKDKSLFKKVRIGWGGEGLVWNDKLDLATIEIYNNGEDVSKLI